MPRIWMIWLAACSLSWGEVPKLGKSANQEPSRGRDVRPELSNVGRAQAKKDLRILRGNLSKVRRNLRVARNNRKILESELEELGSIRRSHLALGKRIRQYLEVANASLEKNESARSELKTLEDKLLPQLKDQKDPELKSRVKELTERTQEREDWKKDTEEKRTRVERLGKELSRNLAKVEARVPPLESQIQEWKEKIKQLEGELDRMQLQERRLKAKSR